MGQADHNMLPASMEDSPAVASTKPRSTDFSIAAIMSKESKSNSPNHIDNSPKSIDKINSSRNRYQNNHSSYSQDSPSHRGSETEDFSESDCEKDIDICDDDHKVTSSSAETPVSLKDLDEDDDDNLCSPGDRGSPTDEPSEKTNNNHSISKKSSKSSRNKVEMKGRCNCDELLLVNCHLETKELWDKFHDLGTEMIITKTGRQV